MFKKSKMFIITIVVVFSLLTCFSCQMGEKQTETPPATENQLSEQQQRLVQELNDWLFPLGVSPLELTDNELSFLDQLGPAKMVGLGEATHGTREFFQMKHRIFQYLVEHFNHKAFGFEADFAECIYINNYIINGEGDLEELMVTKMHFWTWKTDEVRELLEWMREYNRGKNEEEMIHYIGFDCQYSDLQPDLIREYLEPLLPDLWEAASPVMEQLKNISLDDYRSMSAEVYNDIIAQLDTLETQLAADKNQLIADSSSDQYEITRQLVRTLKQSAVMRYNYYGGSGDNTMWRDIFMAENAQWIADFFGKDTKISLWAHNGHVERDDQYGGTGSMGYHLGESLGDSYQVVGFAFSTGSLRAVGSGSVSGMTHQITAEPRRNSVNFIFHNASQANFAFQVDNFPAGSEWDNWLSEPRPLMWIGAVFNGNPETYYWDTKLDEEYNWMIYIDDTTNSRLMSEN